MSRDLNNDKDIIKKLPSAGKGFHHQSPMTLLKKDNSKDNAKTAIVLEVYYVVFVEKLLYFYFSGTSTNMLYIT